MRVVDAPALIEALMHTAADLEIGRRLFEEGHSLHAPLLTRDERLAAAPHHARVEVV